MRLSQLILDVGDEQVEMQNLDDCSITLDYNIKKGTRITFGTYQPLTPNGTDKLGLVIWLPREAVKAALAKERAANAQPVEASP